MFAEEESRRSEGEKCSVGVVLVIEMIKLLIHVIVKASRWYKYMIGCYVLYNTRNIKNACIEILKNCMSRLNKTT